MCVALHFVRSFNLCACMIEYDRSIDRQLVNKKVVSLCVVEEPTIFIHDMTKEGRKWKGLVNRNGWVIKLKNQH